MKKDLIIAILPLSLLLSSLTPTVLGATVEEQQIDLQVREIAKTLRCTICQNESIWESQAELAQQMRDLIRERLLKGESPDQIRAYFLSRYGDYILLTPQKSGMNWILWAGPFVLLAGGGILLYRTVSRWVAQTAAAKQDDLPPIDDRLRKRIEEELHSRED
ncbi:MAG: cytochrome c-type biogenesis protein CcmH [Nitrospirae bacterium]|nr:cytochrome c-type biogenesis protein CcmH [Nitrospirota bacterium]